MAGGVMRLRSAFNLLAFPLLCQVYTVLRIARVNRDEQYREADYLA